MADSLFDNRYRYDYIYPRGRSGETLRAIDTQAGNRPVVIKRPAPNDAPPIRAGQEVSILNERKALLRLAGHPVLTELLGTGQFSVGGVPHQYIVIERGQGLIIADLVLELAARGERLPELEMLVIIDRLLDLLQAAHDNDIVYNDVDAKHLFWDRDAYRLKLIDWGNAVFLEGDEVTPQGVSRQSDIGQVGELLYFILTGGGRADIPRDAGENFRPHFGDDEGRVPTRLQGIVSRALHPNLRHRYGAIAELHRELADYRAPLVRERDTILGRVGERLRRDRSRDELEGLLEMLAPALSMDPGYPRARELQAEIETRLQDLAVAADLDAVRIYMESGNWSRAVRLLEELRGASRGQTGLLINLLFDFAIILLEANAPAAPVIDSIALIFEGHPERAARLLTVAGADGDRALLWRLAERISSHVPEVQILRPNLYRLERALADLAAEGVPLTEPRAVLAEISATLEAMPASAAVGMVELRDGYRAVVDGLTALQTLLEAVSSGRDLGARPWSFNALERALIAAMALADNMHVIGKQATASPRDALEALDNSRSIDPVNDAWDLIERLLSSLYELLGTYQTYVPAADGSDLAGWLEATQRDLEPFNVRLFDEMLSGMLAGLEVAARCWADYDTLSIEGSRTGAVTALTRAAEMVSTISPTLAGWLNQLRAVVNGASYIERHALYGGLGRALADGWEAFDRGRLAEAEQLGERAFEIARNDAHRFAAGRLRGLAEIGRTWLDRNAINDVNATKAALVGIERLFTADERATLENFTRQMPSNETYLKAMNKGLVDLYHRGSTAASRILFLHYIMLGVLDTHEGQMEDAAFWHDAALRALEPHGQRHAAVRALDEFIVRRQDINAAADLLNGLNGPAALAGLDAAIKTLEESPQSRSLSAGAYSLRELTAAARDWSDGEFRAAGIKLENAINAVGNMEAAAAVTLTAYRAWLVTLQRAAAELHTAARQLQSAVEARPEAPTPALLDLHRRQYALTRDLLGDPYAGTLRQWLETYEGFASVFSDTTLRRSARLTRFNDFFRLMFIDRHPAYPAYRHWYDLTERAPEFPPPPTADPMPRLNESEEIAPEEYSGTRYADPVPESVEPDADPEPAPAARRRPPSPLVFIVAAAALIVVLVAAALLSSGAAEMPAVAVTITDTPDAPTGTTVAAALAETPAATAALTEIQASPTPPSPTDTPTDAPVTVTEAPTEITPTTPAPSPTPTDTPTPTATFTITPSPTATLPPGGLTGQQDLLALLGRIDPPGWTQDAFSRNTDATWRLGVGAAESGDGTLYIPLPAAALDQFYGGDAARRITRVEVTLALETYFPPLLIDDEVYFGLLLSPANAPADGAGLQVNLQQPGVINLGRRNAGTAQFISQRSVGAVIVRVRLDRDPVTGAVGVFYNDELIGEAVAVTPGEPVIPVLFVRQGGIIVTVSRWSVTLR